MAIPVLLPVLVFLYMYRKDLYNSATARELVFGDDDDILDTTILLLTVLTVRKVPFVHSRNHRLFHKSLYPEMRRLRDRRIPRAALHAPSESAWWRLYLSMNNQALVTLTGFDHNAFQWLLQVFEPVYNLQSR